jgi:hypothetical protein
MKIKNSVNPPSIAIKSKRVKKVVSLDVNLDDDKSAAGGSYFSIQKPLIFLIEEYLINHPVGGKRMTLKDFCESSGVSVANMTAIVNGNRWVAKCSRDTIEKLATALDIAVLQVFILSGFISSSDVILKVNEKETVQAIYQKMVKDKRMTFRAPTEEVWETWPMSAKLSVCMMYEALIEKVLLRYATA